MDYPQRVFLMIVNHMRTAQKWKNEHFDWPNPRSLFKNGYINSVILNFQSLIFWEISGPLEYFHITKNKKIHLSPYTPYLKTLPLKYISVFKRNSYDLKEEYSKVSSSLYSSVSEDITDSEICEFHKYDYTII